MELTLMPAVRPSLGKVDVICICPFIVAAFHFVKMAAAYRICQMPGMAYRNNNVPGGSIDINPPVIGRQRLNIVPPVEQHQPDR